MKPTLREILQELALDVWERLRDAQNLEVRLGEETITDLLLLDIKRKRPVAIIVRQTSKYRERTQGTDWEWWIGSDRVGWLRYAVQAKRLHLEDDRYPTLGHKIGYVKQIDVLDKYAGANHAIPIYCFYNFATGQSALDAWQCCQPQVQEQQLGCTIAPSHVVRDALTKYRSRNFHWIHSHHRSIPWRCLVGCPRFQQLYARSKIAITTAAHRPVTEEFLELFGLSVRVYPMLPEEVAAARETGEIQRFPRDQYSPAVELYPRRIAILEFSEAEEAGFPTL